MNLNAEEKEKIVARAKKVGTRKAAEELGMTYYQVRYLRYYDKKKPVKKTELMPAEVENIILKEKLLMLTEQRNKLKVAVESLA